MLKIGFQKTPVDSMATWVTPCAAIQSAINRMSRDMVAQWRVCRWSRPPGSIRRTQASTDSLCISKPAQHRKMFSMTDSSLFAPLTRERTSRGETICPACSSPIEATIWGTERCPDQTDGRAIALQGWSVFIPRGVPHHNQGRIHFHALRVS